MPIMSPEIQNVLREAGIEKSGKKNATLTERLNDNGLSVDKLMVKLSDQLNGGSEQTQLRALDTAFKLHGILKDATPPPPSVTIVINDPSGKALNGINPILIPRPPQEIIQ